MGVEGEEERAGLASGVGNWGCDHPRWRAQEKEQV